VGLVPLVLEWRFSEQRTRVLTAPPARLERWTRHMVVGYTSFEELRTLLEHVELGGIYVTARNVRGRQLREVRLELQRLQAIQRARGRPPLLVAADQEGGAVSRLTPPLAALPGLGEVARTPDWRGAVRQHARRQARALRRLGVTMNLAPVVDLVVPGIDRRFDTHTRLEDRAIGSEPSRVAEVAQLYAETLWQGGVLATAKHFPGLGYVPEDTHHLPGRLTRSKRELQIADWVPFERLAHGPTPSAVMVAHVRAERIDVKHLASTSALLVRQVLRRELGHRGLVITDDMCMSPIYYSEGGIAARTVEALAAGVDLVLISFDPDQIYPALADLLKRGDAASPTRLAQSLRRIKRIKARLAAFRSAAPATEGEQQEHQR
jgi:beta-N-acetylhexosaminidase